MVPWERSVSYPQLYRPMNGKELFMLPYVMQQGILGNFVPWVTYKDQRDSHRSSELFEKRLK